MHGCFRGELFTRFVTSQYWATRAPVLKNDLKESGMSKQGLLNALRPPLPILREFLCQGTQSSRREQGGNPSTAGSEGCQSGGTMMFLGREMKGTEELGGMKMASEGGICLVLG